MVMAIENFQKMVNSIFITMVMVMPITTMPNTDKAVGCLFFPKGRVVQGERIEIDKDTMPEENHIEVESAAARTTTDEALEPQRSPGGQKRSSIGIPGTMHNGRECPLIITFERLDQSGCFTGS